MEYPERFIKGVPNSTLLTEDNIPLASLMFDESRDDQGRQDNNLESSINWEDDEGSLQILLKQKKANDKYQFSAGAVFLSRDELDRISKNPTLKGRVSYERHPIEGNYYHGNLLLQKGLPKNTRNMIASHIAISCFIEHVPNKLAQS